MYKPPIKTVLKQKNSYEQQLKLQDLDLQSAFGVIGSFGISPNDFD